MRDKLHFKKMITQDLFLETTKKQILYFNFFWLGMAIYIFSFTLSRASDLNFIVFQSFQIIGLVLIFSTSFNLIKSKIDNPYLKIVYLLYCSWNFILVLIGFKFQDYDFIKFFFFHLTFGGIIYLAPLILLLPRNLFFYKKTFDIIIFFGIFYIVYDILFLKYILNSDRSSLASVGVVELSADLSLPIGFIFLTYAYHSIKAKILAVGIIILTLLFAIIRARRGLIFMSSSLIIFSYISYLFTSKRKFFLLFLSMVIVLIAGIWVNSIYRPEKSIFGFILERGDEDTRTNVELYFYNDMKTNDWILGRGINGQYYCPDIEQDQLTNYRDVIETGYLQIILKGGIISLGLFFLITIPAIIKGLFYSQNLLSKAAAIWIFLVLISLYPAIINTFSLRYLLAWICIGICYSKNIRNIPEYKMREYFRLFNK